MSMQGKSVLITGASKGIGESAAYTLGELGANLVLAARSKKQLENIATAINEKGGQARTVVCDVSDYEQVQKAVDFCVAEFGQLDVLVNNAGVIDPIARLSDSSPSEWAKVIDINLKGVYFGLRAALPVMEQQGSGVVINISSGAATGALEGWSHYCASKAGALSLTKCAHKEMANKGIRVVGLSPGTVATDMQRVIKSSNINPVSQMPFDAHISPDWVGRAIAWLCTDAAAEYAGTDFSIKTDEGRKLVGLID